MGYQVETFGDIISVHVAQWLEYTYVTFASLIILVYATH